MNRREISEGLFSDISDGLVLVDPIEDDLQIVDVNPAFVDMTDFHRDDLQGKGIECLIEEQTPGDAAQRIQDSIHRNQSTTSKILCSRKDGTSFWSEWSTHCASEVIADQGKIMVVIKPIYDKGSEHFIYLYEELFEANNDVIWFFSSDWSETLYVNSAYESVFGRSIEALYQHPRDFLRGIHPDNRDQVESAMKKLSGGDSLEIEFRVHEQENYERWVWVKGIPIFDENQRVQTLAGFTRDITERKQQSNRLHESDKRFRRMAESIDEAYFMVDPEYTEVFYVNPAHERLFGVENEELRSNPGSWTKYVLDEDLQKLQEKFEQLKNSSVDESQRQEYRVQHPERGLLHLRTHIYPIVDDHAVTRLVGVTRDITNLRQTQRSYELVRQALDQTRDEIFLINPKTRRFQFVNKTACEKLGYTEDELLDMRVSDVQVNFPVDDWEQHMDEVRRTGSKTLEGTHRRRDGTTFPVETIVSWVEYDGEEFLIALARDITERKNYEMELRESEEQFRQMAENINSVFWLRDLEKDEVVYLSPAYEEIWERELESFYDFPESWEQSIHPDDRDRVLEKVKKIDKNVNYDIKYRILTPSGDIRWIHDRAFPIRDEEGTLYRIAGLAENITKQVKHEEQLENQALYDSLTGIPNRTLFQDRLEVAFQTSERSGHRSFAVMFLDLDDFKRINDLYGHSTGDRILAILAERLVDRCRPQDTVARFGGDEFIFLVDEIEKESDLENLTKRILDSIRKPIDLDGQNFELDASVGICLASSKYDRPEEMIRDADLAMYEAKSRTASTYAFFSNELRENVQRRERLKFDLSKAIQEKEFIMFYQPIFDRTLDGPVGLEALARWNHPEDGLRKPGSFLTVADELHMLTEIEYCLMDTLADDLTSWNEELKASSINWISFNLSSQFLRKKNASAMLLNRIPVDTLNGLELIVELNEQTAFDFNKRTEENIKKIQESGFDLAIDDFGTGYSSLYYLLQLSLRAIKIDKSYVLNIEKQSKAQTIIETSLKLAESLQYMSIAEGVENEKQLRLLQDLECQYFQGFHLGRPRSRDTISAML